MDFVDYFLVDNFIPELSLGSEFFAVVNQLFVLELFKLLLNVKCLVLDACDRENGF
jgi:hypothetical protein